MKKSNSKNQKKIVRSTRGDELKIEHPPAMQSYQLTWNKRLRFFVTTVQTNFNVTYAMICNTILFASTAVAPYTVFDFVRIKFVEVWSPQGTSLTVLPPPPSTCSVSFNGGGIRGNDALYSDTSMTIHPAHVKALPKGSAASLWATGDSNVAFQLNCPVGSVIDLMVELRDLPAIATAALNASVAATVGGIFYRGLDGLPIATTTMPPVGNVPAF